MRLLMELLILIIGVMIILKQHISMKKQKREMLKLCDQIDEILHGKDKVEFDAFQEGELSILSAEIQKMTVRLREQNAMLMQDKQFMKEALEDMSHQLRTPLTSMLLIAGMLRNQELLKLLTQMQWQIETLLSISRLDAGAITFQRNQIQITELIQKAVEPLEISLELKGITLRRETETSISFEGDLHYCTEAVMNILKNCMEHTPSGGEIRIQAEENALYTGILITDSGEGIPEEALPHIFDRFYRGTEFSKSGFGLGLAFARKIITSQNGTLQVSNAEPHGAVFSIRIYKHTEI